MMKRILSLASVQCRAALAAALVFVFATSSPLMARMVEVQWSPEDEQADIRTRDDARAVGFKRAVFEEALDLLPGILDEGRRALLYDHLGPQAFEYVLSYSEVGQTPPPGAQPEEQAGDETGLSGVNGEPGAADASPLMAEGVDPQAADMQPEGAAVEGAEPGILALAPGEGQVAAAKPDTLRMEVGVNRTALKAELKRLGLYFTVNSFQPYDLSLLGSAAGAWDEIGRLQNFTGVTVRRGVEPLLEIESEIVPLTEQEAKDGLTEPAPLWSGRLMADGLTWSSTSRSLDEVWLELWAGFFTRPGAEAGTVERLPLAVSGWYAPDGVQAFDRELSAWDDVVEGAQLREVFMLPDGIAAVWTVRTLDRASLRFKLDQSLPGRGLAWEFSDEPQSRE